MRIAGSFIALVLAALVPITSGHTAAAGPSITIVRPASGATIQGSTLTVAVTVSNFRLVRPVFSHPPVLKGFAGSLQYILDGTANYSPRRDLSAATTHTWTNVSPGPHTVIVRLATSQHLPWPNGPVARVSVTVARPAPPAPHRHAGGASPGVSAAPTTGGGAGISHSALNLPVILLALLLVLLGLAILGRRLAFATVSDRRQPAILAPASALPEPPIQALSVMPAPGESPDPRDEETGIPSDIFPVEEPASAAEPVLPVFSDPTPPGIDTSPPSPITGPAGIPVQSEPVPAAPRMETDTVSRDQAIEMARQWSGVVEGLVRQLDEQEAERRRMLDHIRVLEDRMRSTQAAREQLREASGGGISPDDFQTLRYLTDALQRDPDHIVNLAAIAQHAAKFHDLVDAYARLRQVLSET